MMAKRETPKSLEGLLMLCRNTMKRSEYESATAMFLDIYWMGYRDGKVDAQLAGMFEKSFKEEK